ncbi:MAG: serine hydrolase [Gemmataceae bacterium]
MIRSILAVFLACGMGGLSATEPTLESRIKLIAEAHQGKVAVAVKNLESGESYIRNGDEVMQTASLIKLAIMTATYARADEKALDLNTLITLTKDDKVQGAGILTDHFSDGAKLCTRDLVRLMIRYSDNTATNMVLDQVGIKTVNEWTNAHGLPETRINAKVFKGSTTSVDPARTKKYSLGSTTANETVKLLEMISSGKAVSPESTKAILDHLKANADKDQLLRLLPAGAVVAHKTGATNQVRTDAGIMYVPRKNDKKKTRPIAICVLTNENQDQRWVLDNAGQVTIGKIGKEVWDYFANQE